MRIMSPFLRFLNTATLLGYLPACEKSPIRKRGLGRYVTPPPQVGLDPDRVGAWRIDLPIIVRGWEDGASFSSIVREGNGSPMAN
jgi:hypothetical protein